MPKVLTSDQAWSDQENLNKLCEARTPDTSGESVASNVFYGNARALREYAKHSGRIDLAIQHGVQLGDVWQGEANAPYPVYCWQPEQAGKYRKRVVIGAAPFLYAMALLGDSDQARRGTLFFPAHSTEHVFVEMDRQALADKLRNLPAEYQPVTVCLYWKDVLRGMAKHYRDFRVVSAGHMFDPDYLYRLAHLIRAHKYAASNEVGSHLFFSIAAGCWYFHIDHEYDFSAADSRPLAETRQSKKGHGAEVIAGTIKRLFVWPSSYSWCRKFIGWDYFQTPEGLRETLQG